MGCCVGSGTGNHFLEHRRTKITDAGEIYGALHEAQNIKRRRWCILLILLSLDAPGMSSNHRGRRPGARRSEDARRQSTGVRRSFFANNSSASPAEDVLGLVLLTNGRRAVLPPMHDRSFTAALTREALRAEQRAAAERAVQGVLKVAFCSFLDQLLPRLPPRTPTNSTLSHPSSRKHLSCLLRSSIAPSLLAQQCKLWRKLPEHHYLRFVTVCGVEWGPIP